MRFAILIIWTRKRNSIIFCVPKHIYIGLVGFTCKNSPVWQRMNCIVTHFNSIHIKVLFHILYTRLSLKVHSTLYFWTYLNKCTYMHFLEHIPTVFVAVSRIFTSVFMSFTSPGLSITSYITSPWISVSCLVDFSQLQEYSLQFGFLGFPCVNL